MSVQPEYCYIYNSAGICSYCKDGFSNLNGECYTSNEINQIMNGGTPPNRNVNVTPNLPSASSGSNSTQTGAQSNANSNSASSSSSNGHNNSISNSTLKTSQNSTSQSSILSQNSSSTGQQSGSASNSKSNINNSSVPHCSSYDNASNQCFLCESGYALIDQLCYTNINGCTSYKVVSGIAACT
jgi:hypothetical protein